jgi:hypothetical protein
MKEACTEVPSSSDLPMLVGLLVEDQNKLSARASRIPEKLQLTAKKLTTRAIPNLMQCEVFMTISFKVPLSWQLT